MYSRYLNAPLLLLIWQVAPVDLGTDRDGRVRISFGVGYGDYLFREGAGCFGGTRSVADPYRSASVSVEAWANRKIRARGALGAIDRGTVQGPEGRRGAFGGGQIGFEEKYFGLGLGLAAFEGGSPGLQPSASVRVGLLDGVSVRADYHAPEAGMALIGGPRVGVGLNHGSARKIRIMVGLATTPIPDSARRVGGLLELSVPVASWGGFSFTAFRSGLHRGKYDVKRIGGFGLGGWIVP
ncbi:MAG TPA: hypothetical protein VI383_09035 [Gemmatimonadales bacterium]|nr:hypothetical protein [Gemmatimonadales bacterium]